MNELAKSLAEIVPEARVIVAEDADTPDIAALLGWGRSRGQYNDRPSAAADSSHAEPPLTDVRLGDPVQWQRKRPGS